MSGITEMDDMGRRSLGYAWDEPRTDTMGQLYAHTHPIDHDTRKMTACLAVGVLFICLSY